MQLAGSIRSQIDDIVDDDGALRFPPGRPTLDDIAAFTPVSPLASFPSASFPACQLDFHLQLTFLHFHQFQFLFLNFWMNTEYTLHCRYAWTHHQFNLLLRIIRAALLGEARRWAPSLPWSKKLHGQELFFGDTGEGGPDPWNVEDRPTVGETVYVRIELGVAGLLGSSLMTRIGGLLAAKLRVDQEAEFEEELGDHACRRRTIRRTIRDDP